jgi:hypothetical protein
MSLATLGLEERQRKVAELLCKPCLVLDKQELLAK